MNLAEKQTQNKPNQTQSNPILSAFGGLAMAVSDREVPTGQAGGGRDGFVNCR